MSSSLIAFVVTAALSQVPYGPPPANNVSSGPGIGAYGAGEPFYPFDAYEPWVHGYRQEIPAYGGYHYFRPYNYRHVMPQSQVAAGWGVPATMPYSQGFFRSREFSSQRYNYSSQQAWYPTESERQHYGRYAPMEQTSPILPTGSQSVEYIQTPTPRSTSYRR